MRALAIAKAASRRLRRDRTALFFMLVLPIVIIVIVGAVARGFSTFRVGVVTVGSSAAQEALVGQFRQAPGLAVTSYSDVTAMDKAIARGELDVGVVVPASLQAVQVAGRTVGIELVAEPANTTQQAAAARVSAVVLSYGATVQAAQFATRYAGTFEVNLSRATALASTTPNVDLVTSQVSSAKTTLPQGYEYSAPTELVLFVFLTAVAGGAAVVETRQLGMFERMSAAPVRPGTIIVGESLTYTAIALAQSVLIVAVGALAFGVSWGDPLAAGALLVTWSVVGAGAGMVAGSIFRTPEQASAIGPVVGIAFGMLGGCMWPLAIVSPTMRMVGHATPQAWAVDAWARLLTGPATLSTIAPQLGILAAFALGFFALATLRYRHVLTAHHR